MYSGHDTTVAPILHTLGVFNGIAPPYASMIIFELFEGESLQVKFTLVSELSQLPSGENLLQEHNRHCLPPNTPWMHRAVPY